MYVSAQVCTDISIYVGCKCGLVQFVDYALNLEITLCTTIHRLPVQAVDCAMRRVYIKHGNVRIATVVFASPALIIRE